MDPELEDYEPERKWRITYCCTCESCEDLENLYYAPGSNDRWKKEDMPTNGIGKTPDKGKSNLHSEEYFDERIKKLDRKLQKLPKIYEEFFGIRPSPGSCKKLVEMYLKLKPEFEKQRLKRRPYPVSADYVEEIERQVQECEDTVVVLQDKNGEYLSHCSPCFLVAKPSSTAILLVEDYGELNKDTRNPSGSLPNIKHTLQCISSCRHKTKRDKRSAF